MSDVTSATPTPPQTIAGPAATWPECVEHGLWTNIPTVPPATLDAFTLKLSHVDSAQNDAIKTVVR